MGEENKKFDLKSIDYKKYLPIAGIAVAVIIVIIIISSLMGGPKKAVKKYVSALSSGNIKKMYKSMDNIGSASWSYYNDIKDFDKDDYEEFVEKYEENKEEMEEMLEEYEDMLEEQLDSAEEYYEEFMDDYKTVKVKVEEFKEVEKLGKGLYLVKAKISTYAKPKDKDEDEIDESEVMEFIVYKNKIIDSEINIW